MKSLLPFHARFKELLLIRERWRAFQDQQYLAQCMAQIFPPVALPFPHPTFWQFLLDPEYYLYCIVILILDGDAMVGSFLEECGDDLPRLLLDTDNDVALLIEAQEIHQLLQSVNLPHDFFDIVEACRRASLELLARREKTAM